MSDHSKIHDSLRALQNYIEAENYRGWDPYDGLTSPLFRLPVLRSHKSIRFLSQQAIKRSPVNLRPLLGIQGSVNPVTLGLCIQGYAYLSMAMPEEKESYRDKIRRLTEDLISLSPYFNPKLNKLSILHSPFSIRSAYSGASWGYPFDWQARYASIPAYQPNVVATGIITNGLYEAWRILGLEQCGEMVVSAAAFVMNDLNRIQGEEGICFSYSPFDRQKVLNASMKAARILVQAAESVGSLQLVLKAKPEGSAVGSDQYHEPAEKAVNFVIAHQRDDGSFPYSLAQGGGWADSYHTGYVLDCLDDYIRISGDESKKPVLSRGFGYFKDHFIAEGMIPKIYSDRTFPVDCTAAGQVILTLCRFKEYDLAYQTASWTIDQMQSNQGNFYYRLPAAGCRLRTDFMRWSDAWMFAALSLLLSSTKYD